MGFLGLTKFLALAGGVTGIIATVVVKATSSKTSNTKINIHDEKNMFLTDKSCYIVETTSSQQDQLLACSNKKYYLNNLSNNSFIELKDLKTLGESEVSSVMINKDKPEEIKKWTMKDDAWKTFPKDINLGLEDKDKLKANGYCFIAYVLDRGRGMSWICDETSSKNLGSIKLIPFV
ncbi:hypothetical protein OVS_03360 [Mycoplasma ovis str. Michigan]|uniref:Uncharacterized protein n=1 Tax=Mycoplasma ovis str. Michigan TaxID=1415773 RepID=A0ABM5P1Z3_9MOLU|nr:hypothetical protein [Mycoplasma ovis]AHC40424.1 hypothetical protein OVS_03360 [Mycoplasma ovis str. Michigan]